MRAWAMRAVPLLHAASLLAVIDASASIPQQLASICRWCQQAGIGREEERGTVMVGWDGWLCGCDVVLAPTTMTMPSLASVAARRGRPLPPGIDTGLDDARSWLFPVPMTIASV